MLQNVRDGKFSFPQTHTQLSGSPGLERFRPCISIRLWTRTGLCGLDALQLLLLQKSCSGILSCSHSIQIQFITSAFILLHLLQTSRVSKLWLLHDGQIQSPALLLEPPGRSSGTTKRSECIGSSDITDVLPTLGITDVLPALGIIANDGRTALQFLL